MQKIIKGLEEKFFVFVEDAEKKKDLSLLSAANALKRKSGETKQHIKKLEETLVFSLCTDIVILSYRQDYLLTKLFMDKVLRFY